MIIQGAGGATHRDAGIRGHTMKVGSSNPQPITNAGQSAPVGETPQQPEAGLSTDQAQALLSKIESAYPDLDNTLSHEKQVLDDIKDADTFGGLKWYEVPVFFLAIPANRQMIRGQKKLVSELEMVQTERNNLRAQLGGDANADTFQRV